MKLGRHIRTVDDLLSSDDVLELLRRLERERANLVGLVVIKVSQQDRSQGQIVSTFDNSGTGELLRRANVAFDRCLGYTELDE